MNKLKKNNVVNFPSSMSETEREVEAILFAAAEPLDIESIEERISKKVNVLKILEKLQQTYSNRGINLVCISKKWSFRTAQNLSSLMSQQKSVQKNFLTVSIPKLPVLTTEDGIKRIKEFFGKLADWKNINDLIPDNFSSGKNLRRSGKAGVFSGSLELVKEGNLVIKQDKLYDNIYIKEK